MVTVVISAYNQLSTLPLALEAMVFQKRLPDRVIVADDGSSDDTIDWLDSTHHYPFDLRYVTHPHVGYGLTVIENLASKFIPEGRILFTNADVIHSSESVAAHAAIPATHLAGGLIVEIAQPASQNLTVQDVQRVASIFKESPGKLTNRPYLETDSDRGRYGMWGGSISVDASVFHRMDGFNEDYRFLYGGEESDLIERLMGLGLSLAWAYNSTAYHLAHKSRAYGVAALGNTKYRAEYLT